jgi:hypothetical protein
MTAEPARAVLAVVVIVFLGGVAGWWITGGALSEGGRVELVARLQSLPEPEKLPPLPARAERLDDYFVSPGGPVWVSLLPESGAQTPILCRFDRQSAGGVKAPVCQPAPALEKGARFAVGGLSPALFLPDGRAIDGLIGRERETRTVEGVKSVVAPQGTRLTRSFRVSGGQLASEGPQEGVFIGPHTAHAIIAPPEFSRSPNARAFLCATPTGYVRALWLDETLTVTFSANTEESREVSTRVPDFERARAGFTCAANQGSFTWLEAAGQAARVSCDPERCKHDRVALRDIESPSVLLVQELGLHTAVLYEREGTTMLRLGPFLELGHSPSAPLFEAPVSAPSPRGKQLSFVATGTSLLVFVPTPALRVAQLYENGRLEALAPRSN